ncbi:MAG: BhlA/UviB family holin-like peptide [Sarcina sp.]
MGKEVFDFLAAQGVFTVLFCYLLFYVLKENNKRELKYQEIISNMNSSILKIEKELIEIKNIF